MTAVFPLMIGTPEIILICGVGILIFGGKKLPELMKGVGEGVKSFREAVSGKSQPQNETKDSETEDEKDSVTSHSDEKE